MDQSSTNALVNKYGEHPEGENTLPLDVTTIPARDAAQYVERMCLELGTLSERAGLNFLAYLLEVAREEALLQLKPTESGFIKRFDVPPSQA